MTSAVAIRTRRTALFAAALAVAMVGLGFAAVPLYRLFCQVTGFAGTPRIGIDAAEAADAASYGATGGGLITMRFDANQRGGLPWEFRPERVTDRVSTGTRDLAVYIAENRSDEPVTGTATYNVTPALAGRYFTKIQCFCFTEQTLQPGERVRMPVIFKIDPAILTDPDTRDIQEITLSYTFYPVDRGGKGG